MKHHTIKATPGSRKTSKRIGRGASRGNYSGRGMKGQNARAGGGVRPGFEGGQTPLVRRMPKLKGFKNINRLVFMPINLGQLNVFDDGDTVNAESLQKKGLIRSSKAKPLIKLLSEGDLKKKLTIHVDKASQTALEKAKKSSCEVILPQA